MVVGAGVANASVTVSPFLAAKAFAFATVQGGPGQSFGQTALAADDITGVASFTFDLVAPDQLILIRDNTAAAASVGWVVVSLD